MTSQQQKATIFNKQLKKDEAKVLRWGSFISRQTPVIITGLQKGKPKHNLWSNLSWTVCHQYTCRKHALPSQDKALSLSSVEAQTSPGQLQKEHNTGLSTLTMADQHIHTQSWYFHSVYTAPIPISVHSGDHLWHQQWTRAEWRPQPWPHTSAEHRYQRITTFLLDDKVSMRRDVWEQ